MKIKLPAYLLIGISVLALSGCKNASNRRDHCPKFDISSFEPLDIDNNGYLSDTEFQVHRDDMHGPEVPEECHIPYDKGSYERLAGERGMNREEFKVHLQEMDKRAALGK